jgi:tRNA dimethylallyltransferase
VVFLLGTTGVGKSKLSLDLAERLNGEIVNADSMQIYSGNAGIMTAKPSVDEKARVSHHLYDVVDMQTKDFNVNKYLALAIPTIAEIHSRGKLPIVVGGTNYYIEGLLFEKSHLTEEVDWEAFEMKMDKLNAELP